MFCVTKGVSQIIFFLSSFFFFFWGGGGGGGVQIKVIFVFQQVAKKTLSKQIKPL